MSSGEASPPHPRNAAHGVNGSAAAHTAVLRSTFGFDRADERWLGLVREATAMPAGLGMLGPYAVLAEIGRGAQGAVFKAVQPGTQRVIAIKRLAAGAFAGARALARFEREVETASSLSHPGIVTVLGTDTVDGQPVLLMEWVDGEPIDRWAWPAIKTSNGSGSKPGPVTRGRLEMLVQVCDAVAHAHQRGVLHRDLKPSNILVDRDERARVLDFGLAKLVDDAGGRQISRTSGDGIVGTPAYAAPEQLGHSDTPVDTRTDVYALGVVLYQLLTGRLPFEHAQSLPALIDAVRHESPRRPSHTGEGEGGGAELDAIVCTALAKEPQRRYQSADALAADIRRHLSGQVVLAHPPSATYQFRKLVSRHRMVFGVATAAIVAVATLAVVSSVLAARLAGRSHELAAALAQAQTEADRNSTSVEFLQGMLDSMGQAALSGEVSPARIMMRDARASLESGTLAIQPDLEVTLWRRLAETSFKLTGDETEELVAHTARLCEERLAPDHVEAGHCRHLQGLVAEHRGDGPRAESLYRESSRIFTAALGSESAENALVLNNIGVVLTSQRRFDESLQVHEQALAIRTRLFGPVHRDVSMSLRNLGSLMRVQKKFDAAAEYYQSALEVALKCGPATDRAVLGARMHIARLARDQGNLEEAEAGLREGLAAFEHIHGEESPSLHRSLVLLADVLARQKRWDEAVDVAARALTLCKRHNPPDHGATPGVMASYGDYLMNAGRPDEAEVQLRAAVELAPRCDPPATTTALRANRNLVKCLRALGRADEASRLKDQLSREAREQDGRNEPESDPAP